MLLPGQPNANLQPLKGYRTRRVEANELHMSITKHGNINSIENVL